MRQFSNLHLLQGRSPVQRLKGPSPPPDNWNQQVDQAHQQMISDWMASHPSPPDHGLHNYQPSDQSANGQPTADPRQPHSGERIRGWADIPLLPAGVKQGQRNGQLLKQKGGAYGIYTPSLRRSLQSAHATSQSSGIPIAESDPAWATRGWGSLDGQPLKDNLAQMIHYQKTEPDAVPPGGGESTNQYFQRFLPKFHQLMQDVEASGEKAVLINHHSGIKAIEAWFKAGMPQDYSADLHEFTRHDGEPGDAYLISKKKGGWEIEPFDLGGKEPIPPASIILTRHGKTAWNGQAGESDEGTKPGGKDRPVVATPTSTAVAEATQPSPAAAGVQRPGPGGMSLDEQAAHYLQLRDIMRTPGFARMPSAARVKIQNARFALESRLPRAIIDKAGKGAGLKPPSSSSSSPSGQSQGAVAS